MGDRPQCKYNGMFTVLILYKSLVPCVKEIQYSFKVSCRNSPIYETNH